MGTIADKLTYLQQTKEAIRNAITEKGVEVTADTPFRGYPDRISQIETGRKLPDKVFFYNNMNDPHFVAEGYKVAYVMHNSSDDSYTVGPLDTTSRKWADAAVASTCVGNNTYAIRFQYDSEVTQLDNGFADGCPGFTIGGWFTMSALPTSYSRALTAYGKTNPGFWGLFLRPKYDTLSCDVAGVSSHNIYTIDCDTWYHLAVSVENNEAGGEGIVTIRVYVNANQVWSSSAAAVCDFEKVMISDVNQYPWNGAVKNTFASWGALSQEEIRQMMLRD